MAVPFNDASSQQDALDKARAALSLLGGNPSPFFYQDRWVCVYNAPYDYKALAVTPITLDVAKSALKAIK